ncbi:MAG: DMT family transporter [Spirulinaceae cyanobacterium RM2_2_10]|nr:DMT family transporter [Spirulinaceae cyanobacterium RM2_2_10]
MVLLLGVCAVSTGAIFVRGAIAAAGQGGVPFSLFIAAMRMSIAALVFTPAWRQVRRRSPSRRAWGLAIAAGLVLALHFAAWISSLSFTSIAASTTLVTTNPVWVALLAWGCWGERPRRGTALGIAIALGGGVLVAWGGAGESSGSQPLLGNLLALIGAWGASLYFLLGSAAQRQGLGVGSYAAIAYSTAAIALLPLPLLFGDGYAGYPSAVYLFAVLAALVPQVLGHTSCNWALRWLSPTLVTLGILFEPVSSSLLGWFFFQEVPGSLVLVGAPILLAGVAIAVLSQREAH